MEIESFLKDCRESGVHLYVKNGELGYRAKKGAMTQDTLCSIRERKSDILTYLKDADPPASRFQLTSTSENRGILFNRFLWKDYSNRVMEVSSANVTRIVIRQTGEMLTDSLKKSIRVLLDRHKILSSTIEISGSNLYLVHRPKQELSFQEIFLKCETIERRNEEAMRIANDLVWEEYNLDNDPLYRVFLIRISPTEYILGVGLHHAIGDAISIGIFFQEILSIYGSIVSSIPPRLSPVRFQYMDYLTSMEAWSTSPAGIEPLNYWKDTLKTTPLTGLITNDNAFMEGASVGVSAEERIVFDSDVTRDLKKVAANLRKTLFCILLTAYKIAIWRMTGKEDLVVVSLQAGRLNASFQNVIGDFAMEIAYKTSLAGNPSFAEIAERVTHTMNEAQSHQPIPLDWVRQALSNEGIPFNAPGMSLLSGDTNGTQNPSSPPHLTFQPPAVRHGCHGFPVSCAIEFLDCFGIIVGSMVYRKDIYDESTIQAFLDHLKSTVSDVIRDPGRKLYDFMDSDNAAS